MILGSFLHLYKSKSIASILALATSVAPFNELRADFSGNVNTIQDCFLVMVILWKNVPYLGQLWAFDSAL